MFPSVLNTFNRPTTTDRLNSPSHSALHNTVSSALGQVQAVIGTSTSSAVGTIFYDVRSPDSNGGGHVQTANKGGTGQTTFTKGDLLVATSASVISKLAVGSDGQVLQANSSVAAGVAWSSGFPSVLANVGSVITKLSLSSGETSLISITLPGSILSGTSGGLRMTAYIKHWQADGNTSSTLLNANFGNTRVASVLFYPYRESGSTTGRLEFFVAGTGVANSVTGSFNMLLGNSGTPSFIGAATNGIVTATGTFGSELGSSKVMGISLIPGDTPGADRIDISGFNVQKI